MLCDPRWSGQKLMETVAQLGMNQCQTVAEAGATVVAAEGAAAAETEAGAGEQAPMPSPPSSPLRRAARSGLPRCTTLSRRW